MAQKKFIYIVLEEGEYDKSFATKQKAQEYCNKLNDKWDTESWIIVTVPIKDIQSLIY